MYMIINVYDYTYVYVYVYVYIYIYACRHNIPVSVASSIGKCLATGLSSRNDSFTASVD